MTSERPQDESVGISDDDPANDGSGVSGGDGEESSDVASEQSSSGSTVRFPAWHSAVAGGVAGAGSRMATAPLDLIRIRRQLAPRTLYPSESIWRSWVHIVEREGGIRALYRGNVAAIYLWMGYSGVQFSLYRHAKESLEALETGQGPGRRPLPSTVVAFVAGATAGVVATLATYPFDVCRTTFAARGIVEPISSASSTITLKDPVLERVPFHSLMEPPLHCAIPRPPPPPKPPATLLEFVWQLYRAQGVRGFYAGAGPAVLQIIPYMGLTFGLYEIITAHGNQFYNATLVAAYAGSVSGAVSKLAVYPLDTVKRRLQAQAFYPGSSHSGGGGAAVAAAFRYPDESRPYRGMVDCARRICAEEGVASLYRGVVPSVLKSSLASALSFALYRSTKTFLEGWHDHRRHIGV